MLVAKKITFRRRTTTDNCVNFPGKNSSLNLKQPNQILTEYYAELQLKKFPNQAGGPRNLPAHPTRILTKYSP
jgi:hypothetical protein